MRLLVTRPEPENTRTAARLRALGHEVLLAPLLRFEALPDATWGAGPFAAVLITSANAIRALALHPRADALRGLPTFAVGHRSAEAARAVGFANVAVADGHAGDLANLVASELAGETRPLLHLAGEDHGELASALARSGLAVETAVVYRMSAAAALPGAVLTALAAGEVGAVLHFSPRTAETYLSCIRAAGMEAAGLSPTHACLSPGVAAPLRGAGAARVAVAARPNEDAMLGLIAHA